MSRRCTTPERWTVATASASRATSSPASGAGTAVTVASEWAPTQARCSSVASWSWVRSTTSTTPGPASDRSTSASPVSRARPSGPGTRLTSTGRPVGSVVTRCAAAGHRSSTMSYMRHHKVQGSPCRGVHGTSAALARACRSIRAGPPGMALAKMVGTLLSTTSTTSSPRDLDRPQAVLAAIGRQRRAGRPFGRRRVQPQLAAGVVGPAVVAGGGGVVGGRLGGRRPPRAGPAGRRRSRRRRPPAPRTRAPPRASA